MRSCMPDGRGICVAGHVMGDDDYFYTINPDGGYGCDEVLCCEKCIKQPKYADLRNRMIDAGAKELKL